MEQGTECTKNPALMGLTCFLHEVFLACPPTYTQEMPPLVCAAPAR